MKKKEGSSDGRLRNYIPDLDKELLFGECCSACKRSGNCGIWTCRVSAEDEFREAILAHPPEKDENGRLKYPFLVINYDFLRQLGLRLSNSGVVETI